MEPSNILAAVFFEERPYCSQEWLHQFAFPPTVHEGSPFSAFSPTLVVSGFFENSHFNWCEVTSHCGCDLHLPDDW